MNIVGVFEAKEDAKKFIRDLVQRIIIRSFFETDPEIIIESWLVKFEGEASLNEVDLYLKRKLKEILSVMKNFEQQLENTCVDCE